MPLNTSSKRRSSVALWAPWQAAPPSPTDSPGTIDAADREHSAGSYSGIAAGMTVPSAVHLVGMLSMWTWPAPMGLVGAM